MKLTGKQIIEARKFYNNHRNYVNDLLKTIHKGYPPTLTEDKNSPALWKAAHWKWFFENIR